MIRKEKQGIVWLEFPLLQEFTKLKHAVFLRNGGVSLGEFASLNVSHSVGDNPLHVEENRRLVQKMFPYGEPVIARAVHGNKVQVVFSPQEQVEGCDGLVTSRPGQPLWATHADCQTAVFYDPKCHLLANVHCGWRGNVQNIYARTIEQLQSLGSRPENIFVCISPSLGPTQAEFIHYKTEWPHSFWGFRCRENYFDLWALSTYQLEEMGILSSHIEVAKICTREHPEDFFSFRRDKVTGRNVTTAVLL
ncbi:MAG: peptidoglycan editing factor PgeF [Chlamydiae bacterium]|nr:peptidoglycan editing factor PgeF [Chlamydiota bacterium]